jgi:hypothetical protein
MLGDASWWESVLELTLTIEESCLLNLREPPIADSAAESLDTPDLSNVCFMSSLKLTVTYLLNTLLVAYFDKVSCYI